MAVMTTSCFFVLSGARSQKFPADSPELSSAKLAKSPQERESLCPILPEINQYLKPQAWIPFANNSRCEFPVGRSPTIGRTKVQVLSYTFELYVFGSEGQLYRFVLPHKLQKARRAPSQHLPLASHITFDCIRKRCFEE